MEDRPRALVAVAFAALVATIHPLEAQAPPATAAGALTVNGTTARLTQVFVSTQPGLFDKTTEDIRLVFATDGVTEKASADSSTLNRLARNGEAQAVEVILDAEGSPMSGFIYAAPFNGTLSTSGMHRFERTRFEPKFVAGRMFMDTPSAIGGVTYQYDVTFAAAIPRAPTAEEAAAALASPAGQAAAAYVARTRGKSADMPADSQVVALVQKTPATAVATVQGMRDGIIIESTITLVLEGGLWMVR